MSDNIQNIPLDQIAPSFGNDRTVFDPAALQSLADSIRVNGLAQPITVRPLYAPAPDLRLTGYQLIAGERRYRAHKLLDLRGETGFATIRAIVTPMSDDQAAAVMLAENTGRKDLDPIDEASAYQRRMKEYGWDEKTCADKAGVNVQIVRNRLKLLTLRDDIQFLVRSGNLQLGYAAIIADADLDNNRQLIALKRLNECPAPTPQWLRKECAALAEAQASTDMFDNALFAAADFSGTVKKQEFTQKLPADPRKDKAPMVGKTYQEMITHQIEFWMKAADDWDRYGKSAQRDRCLAAMTSLQAIVAIMPKHSNKSRKISQDSKTYFVYASV